jgi:hypothetical protein
LNRHAAGSTGAAGPGGPVGATTATTAKTIRTCTARPALRALPPAASAASAASSISSSSSAAAKRIGPQITGKTNDPGGDLCSRATSAADKASETDSTICGTSRATAAAGISAYCTET